MNVFKAKTNLLGVLPVSILQDETDHIAIHYEIVALIDRSCPEWDGQSKFCDKCDIKRLCQLATLIHCGSRPKFDIGGA
jgi:hypothetical protein